MNQGSESAQERGTSPALPLISVVNRIYRNRFFEAFMVLIIIASALLVGARTYNVSETALNSLHILDWLITVLFIVELSIRFTAEPDKKRFFKNGWNVFDTLVVIISLIPVDNSDVALLGRMVRIFRVLRMVSFVPELRVLLNSLIKAMPQLGYVVLLMFIIYYIYAAIGSTLFAAINPVLWGDIGVSLLTLFRVMTFEDWTDVMYETMETYPMSWIYFLSFIFFAAFAFLNMVIGIIVNIMEREHAEEQEKIKQAEQGPQPTLADLQQEIRTLKQLIEGDSLLKK